MTNKNDKLFVVRTYVMAKNAQEALRKFKKQEPHECWVDDEWKKGNGARLESAIGFEI
jgi:hypothetical protein